MPFQLPVSIETRTIPAGGFTLYYPQVSHLANQAVQNRINARILNLTRQLIQQQGGLQGTRPREMFSHFEIKTNERGILSLLLSNYVYFDRAAHGMTVAKSLTFDVNTGREYRLQDLFSPGVQYVQAISAAVHEQIRQRQLPLLAPFTSIRPDQDYYLADKALVVYFQLYEITPYYVGLPMFPIPLYRLQGLAPENSPIQILSADVV